MILFFCVASKSGEEGESREDERDMHTLTAKRRLRINTTTKRTNAGMDNTLPYAKIIVIKTKELRKANEGEENRWRVSITEINELGILGRKVKTIRLEMYTGLTNKS
jgi:hypothetical protein